MRKDLRSYKNTGSNKIKWTVEDVDRLSVKTLKQQRIVAYDKLISVKHYIKYPKALDMVEHYTEKANQLELYIEAIDKKLN